MVWKISRFEFSYFCIGEASLTGLEILMTIFSRQGHLLTREWRLCLKFSFRKPYMMGLEQTELMAERWQQAKKTNMTLVSSSLFLNGSKISIMILKMLRGAQERKKMTLTVMSILLVFLLRSICRALL